MYESTLKLLPFIYIPTHMCVSKPMKKCSRLQELWNTNKTVDSFTSESLFLNTVNLLCVRHGSETFYLRGGSLEGSYSVTPSDGMLTIFT